MGSIPKNRLLNWYRIFIPALFFFALPAISHAQFYNGSQMTFGKSRVQYNDFLWTYFRFDKFDVYFYLNGKELATYAAEYADKHIKDIEMELESNVEEKIQFIIYNNLSDLKQSNIGQTGDWDTYNIGGVTRIIRGKVLIYFDGNYDHFEQQIRAGIAQVILNEMIYGAGIGAQIKNNALFSMPEWYLNGLISYVSEKWNPEIENQVKDAVLAGKYDKFNSLTGLEAAYAGHSLWYFISQKYGESTIPNIIYMARLSRNIEKGFMYVLGINFKDLVVEWMKFYRDLYTAEFSSQDLPSGNTINKKKKRDLVYRQCKFGPDSSLLAYCTHELGVYRVYVRSGEKGKTRKIYRGGYRIAEKPDYSYPLLAWHPSGKVLAMVVERKGEIYLYFYFLDDKHFEKQILYDFQKVLDFSYSDDGSLLVMSAIQRGQSDIFVFNIASGSYQQITRDVYNDFNPRFVNNSRDIIFSSNRNSDTIRFDEKVNISKLHFTSDIFLYNYTSKKNVLHRITDTPMTDEIQPMPYADNFFCYLSDQNGIYNRFLARFDSAISYIDTTTHYRYFTTSYPVTNYSRNILEHATSIGAEKVTGIVFRDQKYTMYQEEMLPPRYIPPVRLQPTGYNQSLIQSSEKEKTLIAVDTAKGENQGEQRPVKKHFSTVHITVLPTPEKEVLKADTVDRKQLPGLPFGLYRELLSEERMRSTKKDTTDKYRTAKQLNYNVEYSIDQLVTQIDFSYFSLSYQYYTGSNGPIYQPGNFVVPGFNALFMVGITDLMEDYKITGGVRLDFNLINNEYLFSYMNMKRRLHHQILFHRQTVEYTDYYSYMRDKINELYYSASYPLSPVLTLKGTAGVRYDRLAFLSTDQYNLKQPTLTALIGTVKCDLTYDNTRDIGVNLYYGTRYKIFGEYYQDFHSSSYNMFVVGADFRHYQKIHRTMILALRVAGSTSFGFYKLIYYMGGVDNWLWPKFDQSIPVAPDQNYAFQTLATNLRGFPQNIRNGNSFVVINAELRLPVFRYFYNRPIRSDFLNNFQIVAFGDAGTAWTGLTPYSKDNTLFTNYIYQDPLFIKVQLLRDPFVEGVGFGIRSRVLGYFIRGDVAWGLEDGYWRQPVYYLSLSLDF
jgi:Tol biopolymer transport system component